MVSKHGKEFALKMFFQRLKVEDKDDLLAAQEHERKTG